MRLTDEQIRSITKGAVEIVQRDGFLCFYRFSHETVSYYTKTWENYGIRSRASSGVRFDFYTDSEKIKISYRLFEGSSQTRGSFDIYIDSKLFSHLGEQLVDGNCRSIEKALPKGEKRVTVYFPTLAQTQITSVELSDRASVRPAEKKPVALFYGDSITHGYVTDFPSLCYPALFSQLADMDFYNFGVGGDVFNTGVLGTSIAEKPEIVFTAYGTNDWGARDSEYSYKKHMSDYFEALVEKYPTSRIIAISPIWRADFATVKQVGDFDKMLEIYRDTIKEFCRVELVSGLELMPHIEELFFDKFLHPNEIGFSYYARALFEKVLK